jgi:serine/threonine protein kinase
MSRFTREITVLSQLHYPFVADLFEILGEEAAYYLAMEFAEHGCMLDYVNSRGPLSEEGGAATSAGWSARSTLFTIESSLRTAT